MNTINLNLKFLICAIFMLTMTVGSASVLAREIALNDLVLTDQHGRAFHFSELKGQVVMLFFGYTSCPDVCPMEVSLMSQVLEHFKGQGNKLRGIFISVDTQRDTPERIREYVAHFSSELLGLSGTDEQIARVARFFNAPYKVTEQAGGKPKISHASNLLVLDNETRVHTLVPFGLGATHLGRVVRDLF